MVEYTPIQHPQVLYGPDGAPFYCANASVTVTLPVSSKAVPPASNRHAAVQQVLTSKSQSEVRVVFHPVTNSVTFHPPRPSTSFNPASAAFDPLRP